VVTDAKLFQYYERQEVLPTFGNFTSHDDLKRYAEGRERLFRDRLLLPVRIFREADLLEFGPDSGENAMVFGQWGANLTLAEPNSRALGQIRSYFEQFELGGRLRALVSADVAGFHSEQQYDVIDAEGFIYTIQPTEAWLSVFAGLMRPGGYGIISYYERYGGLFELTLKAIHAAAKVLTGKPATESAQLVFQTKWDSIPHTRSFASWVMDVMENPFVRIQYFLDASKLVQQIHAQGFATHSAWPVYADPLLIRWHKADIPDDVLVANSVRHLERSRLSFASGRKLYLAGGAAEVSEIASQLDRLVADVDTLIDEPFGARLQPFIDGLGALAQQIGQTPVIADDDRAIVDYCATLASLQRIFASIGRKDLDGLLELTGSDPVFIGEWGMPTHFLVMRRRAA
jgi:hypothetical protein